MKKYFALLAAMAILITAFSGCKSNSSGSTTDSSVTEKKNITLTFGSHQSGLPTSGIVQKIAKEYEEKTGVKIDFQITPDAQWGDLIKTKLSTGEAPDIFCQDSGLTLEENLHVVENCVDLSKESWVSRMDESVVPMVSAKGNLYGITFSGYKVYWYYYNKEIFSSLNLKAPTNYAEFKNVCAKIKATGVTPIYEACQEGWHQQLPIYELGGLYASKYPNLYDDLNTHKKTILDIPEIKTVVEQMKEFQELGYFGTDYMSNSVSNDEKAFADGKVAMVLQGFGWQSQTNTDFPETTGKMGIFVQPWADNQVLGINPGSNAYFINKKSKYIDEAKAFFEYLAQPDILKERLDGDTSQLALCWDGIDPKYPQSYTDYLSTLEKGTVMQIGFPYSSIEWMDVGKDVSAMYSGAMTADQLVTNMQERVDKQAKLNKNSNWD
jgi:raffinose/stachyose/melibiose transport system substrate-binding protein